MKTVTLVFLAFWSLFILPLTTPYPKKFNYSVDEEKSVVEWTGASPNTAHQGSFAVTSEGIEVIDGQLKGGTFVIPIASIKNYDLPKTIKPVLLKHLKSKDFFNIALYPEAKFTLTNIAPLSNIVEGAVEGANVMVTGSFTLIGNTHTISFPARLDLQENALAVEATFKLNRIQWGMTYAADPKLKNRHIFPEVDIHLKVSGVRNEG